MPYTYPNITGTSSFVDLFVYANDTLSGGFGLGIMALVFMISFIVFKNYTTERALIVSLYITTITGIFLFILGLVTEDILAWPVLLSIFSLAYLYYKERM